MKGVRKDNDKYYIYISFYKVDQSQCVQRTKSRKRSVQIVDHVGGRRIKGRCGDSDRQSSLKVKFTPITKFVETMSCNTSTYVHGWQSLRL